MMVDGDIVGGGARWTGVIGTTRAGCGCGAEVDAEEGGTVGATLGGVVVVGGRTLVVETGGGAGCCVPLEWVPLPHAVMSASAVAGRIRPRKWRALYIGLSVLGIFPLPKSGLFSLRE
jgi:hypothetical protein